MKNTQKSIRISQWREPGLVKKMDTWRKMEEAEKREEAEERIDTSKEPAAKNFKKWNLPDQSEGYIKPKKHDFF